MDFLKGPEVWKVCQEHFSGVVWVTKICLRKFYGLLHSESIYLGYPLNGTVLYVWHCRSQTISAYTTLFNSHGTAVWFSDSQDHAGCLISELELDSSNSKAYSKKVIA